MTRKTEPVELELREGILNSFNWLDKVLKPRSPGSIQDYLKDIWEELDNYRATAGPKDMQTHNQEERSHG